MPASLSRRAPRAIAATLTGCATALVLAAPGLARPADAPSAADSARPAVHATIGTADAGTDPRAAAPTGSLAGTTSPSLEVHATGTDVAAPDQQNPLPEPGAAPASTPVLKPHIAPADDGATTLAVLAIAAAALMVGAGAGFAGARRTALRTG